MQGPTESENGRSTSATGATLQDDNRRLVQPLGATAGGAQLAQVGVGVGVAAAHGLGAGAHADAGLRAPPHSGRGWHPERHHTLQTLAARSLLQAARGALRSAAHLAAPARVADSAALAVGWRRGAARRLAALGTAGGGSGEDWRRAAGPGRQRRGGRRQEQQQRKERGAPGLHGGSDGGELLRAGQQHWEKCADQGLRTAGASTRGGRPSLLASRR